MCSSARALAENKPLTARELPRGAAFLRAVRWMPRKPGGFFSRGWTSCGRIWGKFTAWRTWSWHERRCFSAWVWWSARSRCRWRRRPAPPAGAAEVTFTKHIAPILQRSCESCHRPDGVAPMSLRTYDEVRPVGARDQAAHRHRPARRRDAAVVRREEHRHPEVQERSVAQRRRDRDDREVGRQRRAARQPRRHAAAARVDRLDRSGRSASPISSSAPPTSWSKAPRPIGGARFRACRPA